MVSIFQDEHGWVVQHKHRRKVLKELRFKTETEANREAAILIGIEFHQRVAGILK